MVVKKLIEKLLVASGTTCFLPMMALLACGHLGDRTTLVYGKCMTKIRCLWTAFWFW